MADAREWMSVSDLMSVLFMVFLFVAVLFMLQVRHESEVLRQQHAAMKQVAEARADARHGLHDALQKAFAQNLAGWDAEILPDGTVRFNNPELLFESGRADLSERFRAVLREFFPRYAALLSSRQWRDEIDEVRIEGHTSSDWGGEASPDNAYLRNARLSQARAFAVLEHVYGLPAASPQRQEWLRGILRATGVSSARPLLTAAGEEDRARSRRVEFRAQTRDDEKMDEILRHSRAVLSGI